MLAFMLGAAGGAVLGHLLFGNVLPAAACACIFGIVASSMAQSRAVRGRGNRSGDGGGDGSSDTSGDSWSSGGDCSDGGDGGD
jgi:hypothetical protein